MDWHAYNRFIKRAQDYGPAPAPLMNPATPIQPAKPSVKPENIIRESPQDILRPYLTKERDAIYQPEDSRNPANEDYFKNKIEEQRKNLSSPSLRKTYDTNSGVGPHLLGETNARRILEKRVYGDKVQTELDKANKYNAEHGFPQVNLDLPALLYANPDVPSKTMTVPGSLKINMNVAQMNGPLSYGQTHRVDPADYQASQTTWQAGGGLPLIPAERKPNLYSAEDDDVRRRNIENGLQPLKPDWSPEKKYGRPFSDGSYNPAGPFIRGNLASNNYPFVRNINVPEAQKNYVRWNQERPEPYSNELDENLLSMGAPASPENQRKKVQDRFDLARTNPGIGSTYRENYLRMTSGYPVANDPAALDNFQQTLSNVNRAYNAVNREVSGVTMEHEGASHNAYDLNPELAREYNGLKLPTQDSWGLPEIKWPNSDAQPYQQDRGEAINGLAALQRDQYAREGKRFETPEEFKAWINDLYNSGNVEERMNGMRYDSRRLIRALAPLSPEDRAKYIEAASKMMPGLVQNSNIGYNQKIGEYNDMAEHFYNGFIKRAQDYGLSVVEADRLVKTAMDPVAFQRVVMPVTSLALGGALMLAANSGIKANSAKDRIDQKELTQWAQKYLNSKKVDVRPRPGINNAYYQKVNDTHVIRYDPRVHKAIGAHEIGHGMDSFPRIPGSSFFGPLLTGMGAFRTGYTGGEAGLAPLLIGAGIQVPTLIDEWMASSNARKILKDNNIKPQGLKRAWLTYAAPLLTAGIGLTGGALLRNT